MAGLCSTSRKLFAKGLILNSAETGYSYIASIPRHYIADKLRPMQQTSYIMMTLSPAVGMAFAYTITRALYNPLRSSVEYINVSSRHERKNRGHSRQVMQEG